MSALWSIFQKSWRVLTIQVQLKGFLGVRWFLSPFLRDGYIVSDSGMVRHTVVYVLYITSGDSEECEYAIDWVQRTDDIGTEHNEGAWKRVRRPQIALVCVFASESFKPSDASAPPRAEASTSPSTPPNFS